MIEMIAPAHRGYPESGESQMALAILIMSVDDLRRNTKWSKEWFFSGAFDFWLSAISPDLNPDVLRDAILHRFAEPDGGRRHVSPGAIAMRERVIRALREHPTVPASELAKRCHCTPSTIRKYRAVQRQQGEGQIEML